MEGISHEACALAGTLGLGKLIALYDDNGISIDSEKGNIKSWFTDDTPQRFEAYGWNVIPGVDGHDSERRRARASRSAKAQARSRRSSAARRSSRKARRRRRIPARRTVRRSAPMRSRRRARTSAGRMRRSRFPPRSMPPGTRAQRGRELEDGVEPTLRCVRSSAIRARRRSSSAASRASCRPTGTSAARQRLIKRSRKAETIATRKASQNALDALGPRAAGAGRADRPIWPPPI